jgi:hypothetical protein
MATGVKSGLTPYRTVGNMSDNLGLGEYDIASGYASNIFLGDSVKLNSTGTIELTTAGDDAIGVFQGCTYTDSSGDIQYSKYWPASTVASDAVAKVSDFEGRTYLAKGSGTVANVIPGKTYSLDSTSGSTSTGRAGVLVEVLASTTGDVDLEDETDIGANITDVADGDGFTVKTSASGASAIGIEIEDGDGVTELLAKLNAVDNIEATLTSDGYLKIEATDGNSLVIAEDTNTPAVDLGLTVGTTTPYVSDGAGHVKLVRVIDSDNYSLEVVLDGHKYRDSE